MKLILYILLAALMENSSAFASKQALIYEGPGACDSCSLAAKTVAENAGFEVRLIGPNETDPSVFQNASLWIQPGGQSTEAASAMIPSLKAGIKEFVREGGGYVGFCAGGFLSTEMIGTSSVPGLGLIAGNTALYEGVPDSGGFIVPLQWLEFGLYVNRSVQRFLYWEGGPYFSADPKYPALKPVEVVATYPEGLAATVRSTFGEGRVYVTGLHPEAPPDWRTYYDLNDPDGLDYDLASDMMNWAQKP